MSTPLARRIPYGLADFVKLRRGNEYDVDKTAYLPLLMPPDPLHPQPPPG